MKKTTKRILSSLLAILLVLTSVPFTSFSAIAADDADLALLKSAISEYENKMNGTVYTNMKNAYDKYINAKEYAYAYEYGHDGSLDLEGAANALSEAAGQMTAWTSAQVVSPTFNYGGNVPTEFVKGIVYASTPQTISGFVNQKWQVAFLMPKDVVFLYDGSDLRIPVMVGGNNQGQWAGLAKAFCAVWPTTGDASSNEDNKYFQFKQVWNGSYDIETSSNDEPLATNEFKWSGAYNPNEQTNQNDSMKGYNNATQAETNADYRSQKINCNAVNENHKKLWRQYANFLQYTDDAKNQPWTNGLQTVKISWGVKSWEQYGSLYYAYYDTNTTFYVIDYRGVTDAINAASSYLDFAYSNGAATKTYTQGQLDDILTYIEALQADPTTGYTSSNFATKAANVASAIKTNIASLNAATAAQNDMSSYDALASAISTAKATYDYNNADGVYTADSFAAFKTAYETSEAEAAIVKTNGFTTATTAGALVEAYDALNVITPASGNSGDTTFTFDEETGTVTIEGDGRMDDYKNGAESPFGNSDNITNAVVGDDVTYVGAHAFDGASELEVITVPASATYGEGAFDNCPKLHTVIITGGAVNNVSADNAPWTAPKVRTVKLGENEGDLSISSIGDEVFEDNKNTVYYFYNKETVIPDVSGAILGTNPTIYGYIPSTAYDYAKKFNLTFVEISHEHVWDGGTVTAPTCLNGGFTTYKCQFCTATKTGDYTAPLGHDWDTGEVIEPTCTERGYTLYTCQRAGCSETKKTDYTKAKGHKYDGEITPEYNTGIPREDNAAHYQHSIKCSVCGDTTGAKKLEYCTFKIKDDLVEWNNEMYTCFECEVCQGTYLYKNEAAPGKHMVFYFGADNELIKTEDVENEQKPTQVPQIPNQQIGHVYSWTLDGVEVDPFEQRIVNNTVFKVKDELVKYDVTYLNADGIIIGTEKVNYGESPADIPELPTEAINQAEAGHEVAKWENDPNGAIITENATFKQELETVAHEFTDTIQIEPTCTEEGSMSRYCEKCGYNIENEPIDALGHDPIDEVTTPATCTEDGSKIVTCSRCDYRDVQPIAAPGHTWDDGVITKQPTIYETGVKTYTCGVCHRTKTESIPKATISEITPSDAEANNAQINNSIQRPAGITTVSNSKKKQLIISFNKVPGAQNYRVMYRGAGESWKYAWTNGTTTYTLKNLKNKGLYEFMFAAYTKNAKGQWERGQYSYTAYRYYYKAKLKKVKGAKKKITVTWKKDKNASGYQLYYSKNKNFTGAKKIEIKSGKKTKYTIKKLKKGKYYVRIRAIKKKGNTYTGEYSKRKAVKVK